MDYCKITTEGQAMNMPNPYRMVVANPTEPQKKMIADIDGWLEKVYTEAPTYDPETQYLKESWVEENGKAVQHWGVIDIPVEPTEETEQVN